MSYVTLLCRADVKKAEHTAEISLKSPFPDFLMRFSLHFFDFLEKKLEKTPEKKIY